MPTYSFKSVGKTQQQQAVEEIQATQIPYGIKTPLELGDLGESIFAMNYSISDQLADNLRNLVLTNWGERLGQYHFGANLRPLLTEYSTQVNFDNQAINRIRTAVERWMPFVQLGTFESVIDRTENKNTAVIKLNITYSIPAIDEQDRAIQIVLYVI